MDKYVIDNFYGDVDYSFEHIKGVMVEDELLNYAKVNQIDLMVMIKHDRGFWGNVFHKSLTKTTAFHTDVPLLVLHDKA
ncbi:MAG: universal stress protein [Crocinitomicaceae bacterium]|nr:universal stress protein [Crocinitomicaceae bacterium]